jgi:hypothetical protein
VLSDWRRGLSADQQDAVELSNAAARSGGTNIEGVLSPAGYDDVEAVGRRFKSYEWSRNPFEACKHEHAVRFEIGVPTAEPPDALSLVSDYWTSRTAQMSLDEMVAPLGHDRFTERLSRSLAFDQHWHGLDPLLEAIGAADVVSVTPSELWLPEVVINEMAIPVQPIAGVHVARLMNSQVIELKDRRFHRSRYEVRPELAETARMGDVWMGRGSRKPAPFVAAATVSDEPFLLQLHGSAAAVAVLP